MLKQKCIIKKLFVRLGLTHGKCVHEQTATSVREISVALNDTLKAADPEFMSLCSDSQELYNNIESLRSQISQVAGLFNLDDDNCSFKQVETLAQTTLAAFFETTREITSSIDSINSLKDEIGLLADHTSRFQESSHYLRIIRTNISMESVRTDRSRELFSALAGEIQQLSEKINKISTNMAEDLTTAHKNQQQAQLKIQSELGNIAKLQQQAGVRINSATSQARTLMELSNNWLARIADNFQAISNNIGQVIISMQFHDIFRQQLEHVIDALKDIESRTTKDSRKISDLAYAHMLALLQAAQIEHACQEVGSAANNIRKAFTCIQNELNQINLNDVCSNTNDHSDQGDIFGVLLTELRQFNKFINEASELNDQTGKVIDMVRKTTMSLTTYMREIRIISRDLSFKALNAIVLTERLGSDGKSLAVLTEEVYNCAGQAQKLGMEVTETLTDITKLSEQLSNDSGEQHLDDHITKLHQATDRMENDYKEFENNIKLTSESISQINSKAQAAIKYIDFIDQIHQQLVRQKELLDQCINILEPYAGHTDHETREKLEQLHNNYTMEQERKIHQKALGRKTSENEEPEPVLAATNTGDTKLDDNIELF